MAYRSLRSFLERLERAGELVRVAEPVDPVLEMAALADRAAKQEGPALLFERPRLAAAGDRAAPNVPVAMNLFGTRRRTAWAPSGLPAVVSRSPDVRYPVLVPNLRGLERAQAAGATDVAVFAAASEGFSRANL